jgi:chloride channel 7
VGYVQMMFFSLAVLTYGTAVPSGQFVPGIMIGATYGRLVGILVVNASSKDSVDEGTYVLERPTNFIFLSGHCRL